MQFADNLYVSSTMLGTQWKKDIVTLNQGTFEAAAFLKWGLTSATLVNWMFSRKEKHIEGINILSGMPSVTIMWKMDPKKHPHQLFSVNGI